MAGLLIPLAPFELSGVLLAVLGLARQARTSAERLLEHPERNRLVEHVESHLGISFQQLLRELQVNRGTARYHLRLLEHAGILDRLEVGKERHFFPPGQEAQDARRISLLQQERPKQIAKAVLSNPGLNQKELNAQIHMTRRSARDRILPLAAADLVRVVRDRKNKRYYPTTVLRELWDRLCGKGSDPHH